MGAFGLLCLLTSCFRVGIFTCCVYLHYAIVWVLYLLLLEICFHVGVLLVEGLDGGGGVWYSLFIKNLAHYSSH